MTDAQTEARAIAERLMLPDEDVFNLAVDIIATALAAKNAELASMRDERDEARKYAGMGCDANDGGAHTIVQQGSYKFCKDCGCTIKNPSLTERCRVAERRAERAEAQLAEARKALDEIGNGCDGRVNKDALPCRIARRALEAQMAGETVLVGGAPEGQQPVAWRVTIDTHDYITPLPSQAESWRRDGHDVHPLFTHPAPQADASGVRDIPASISDDELAQREAIAGWRDAESLSRAGAVKVRELLQEIGMKSLALRKGGPDPMDLHGLSDALEEAIDLAVEADGILSTLEPAAPEGRQEEVDAVIISARKLAREYRPSMDKEVLHSWASDVVKVIRVLSTRPSEHAVTEEMVARASAEYQEIFGKYLLSSHARRILKAAMEAGRHE